MIRIGLLGASGKMGRFVTHLLETEFCEKATLVAAPHRNDSLEPLLNTEAIIDFSQPEAVLKLIRLLDAQKQATLPALILGSTGWSDSQRKELEKISTKTAVLLASNFSTGVLALLHLLKSAAPMLAKLGYSPVITETHHRHKKDAPSGTAVSLQKAVSPDAPDTIQTHSIRAGEIIGDHEVTFYGAADHLTLGHFAQDRTLFARGAIDAALWLAANRAAKTGKIATMAEFFEENYLTASEF